MALVGNNWGANVAAAVQGVVSANCVPGTPITTTQLENIWKAICSAHVSYITNNAATMTPNAASGGSTLPGTVS